MRLIFGGAAVMVGPVERAITGAGAALAGLSTEHTPQGLVVTWSAPERGHTVIPLPLGAVHLANTAEGPRIGLPALVAGMVQRALSLGPGRMDGGIVWWTLQPGRYGPGHIYGGVKLTVDV